MQCGSLCSVLALWSHGASLYACVWKRRSVTSWRTWYFSTLRSIPARMHTGLCKQIACKLASPSEHGSSSQRQSFEPAIVGHCCEERLAPIFFNGVALQCQRAQRQVALACRDEVWVQLIPLLSPVVAENLVRRYESKGKCGSDRERQRATESERASERSRTTES